jgi:hypothetical protein
MRPHFSIIGPFPQVCFARTSRTNEHRLTALLMVSDFLVKASLGQLVTWITRRPVPLSQCAISAAWLSEIT